MILLAGLALLTQAVAAPSALFEARKDHFERVGSHPLLRVALADLRVVFHPEPPARLAHRDPVEVPPLPHDITDAVATRALTRALEALGASGLTVSRAPFAGATADDSLVGVPDGFTEPRVENGVPVSIQAMLGAARDSGVDAVASIVVHVGWCVGAEGAAACVRSPDDVFGAGPGAVDGFVLSRFRDHRRGTLTARRVTTVRRGYDYVVDGDSHTHTDRPIFGTGDSFDDQAADAAATAIVRWFVTYGGRRALRSPE